jgi:hypothetical protein
MKIDMVGKLKEKIKLQEELIANPEASEWAKQAAQSNLKSYKFRLQVLEKSDMNKAINDMSAILSHTHAIDEKYECRSVKFMYWLSEFVGRFSPKAGEKIRKYTVKEIHAPVCSIVSSPRQELPPMPEHTDPKWNELYAENQRQKEELKRLAQITGDWLDYKPTRVELFKERIRIYVNKKLSKEIK